TGAGTLTNDGSIDALSDRAVFGDPTIINNGVIIGFVQLTGVNDITNNNLFELRNFADTNGDGVRDTVRVAVADLGAGPSTFTNNGTLTLPGSPGATTVDNGILVVQALDAARSEPGVFTLGAAVLAGPYEYSLYHGGVGADAANGNWYLRSTIDCSNGGPSPPCPTPPLTPTPTPT